MADKDVNQRLDNLEQMMTTLVNLARLQSIGPDRILSFSYMGEHIQLWLPDAHYDYIQRNILNKNTFYETRLLRQFSEMGVVGPDTRVCDIGANIGNHSVFFGKILGAKEVISFEPQPHVNTVLQRNLELNGMPKKNAQRIIVGDHEGKGSIDNFMGRNLGGTSFKPDASGGATIKRLDDALTKTQAADIGFMKIDVEGAQLAVLEGAKAVIERCKPVIWIELIKDEFGPTDEVLRAHGYRMEALGKSDFVYFP